VNSASHFSHVKKETQRQFTYGPLIAVIVPIPLSTLANIKVVAITC